MGIDSFSPGYFFQINQVTFKCSHVNFLNKFFFQGVWTVNIMKNTGSSISHTFEVKEGSSSAAPTGGSSAAPTGGSSAAPTGGSSAAPTGGSSAAPTGGSSAAPSTRFFEHNQNDCLLHILQNIYM